MKTIKTLSLFSGCGGMDLGFEGSFTAFKKSLSSEVLKASESINNDWARLPRTNFSIVFANDILPEAFASYVPFFQRRGSSHSFHKESIVELVKNWEKGDFTFPEADVVLGGFPCQDFSVAGKRKGFNSHRSHDGTISSETPQEENRGLLYTWMRRVIEITKPKIFIAENVKGLANLGQVKQIIENDFRNIGTGYLVLDARVLHAGNYGVPQTRERVFFIGIHKSELNPNALKQLKQGSLSPYPPKTHYLPGEPDDQLLPFVNLKSIFKGLVEPNESKDPAQQAYSKAKFYGKHVQGASEIKLNSLGPTIRAEHHGNIEFRRLSKENGGKYLAELEAGKQQRRLSVRECARIQTFPDDYSFIRPANQLGREFALSASASYRVIGNAVPPLLAFNLAWHIQKIWPVLFGETNDNK